MHKTRKFDKNCALCSLSIGSKGIPLQGTGDRKNKVMTFLEMLLPQKDFLTLCDKKLFPDPHVCTSCFCTLKKIPNTVLTLQNLLGKSLNIRLYRPNRPAWEEVQGEVQTNVINGDLKAYDSHHSEDNEQLSKCGYNIPQNQSQSSCVMNLEVVHNSDVSFEDCEKEVLHQDVKGPSCHGNISNNSISETPEKRLYFSDDLLQSMSQPDKFNKEKILPKKQAQGKGVITSMRCKRVSENKVVIGDPKITGRPRRKCVKSMQAEGLKKTKTDTTFDEKSIDLYPITDISASESDDEYTPPLKKPTNHKTNCLKDTSKSLFVRKKKAFQSMSKIKGVKVKNEKSIKSAERPQSEQVMIQCIENNCHEKYPSWGQLAHHLKYSHYGGYLPDVGESWLKLSMLAEHRTVNGEAYVHDCIEDGCGLAFTSERSLNENGLLHSTGFTQVCGFPDCPKTFKLPQSLKMHLQIHRGNLLSTLVRKIMKPERNKKYRVKKKEKKKKDESQVGHYKCCYEGCGQSFLKREKLEIHMCGHNPERRLFCEKCGQSFNCQRYLDVHHKIHLKNEAHAVNPPTRSISCEKEGCHKMFTTRENMKSHLLNQHKGRKPRSTPGIFYPCSFPGCGKKFSFRSTLYRHKKLVHRGGDYKLGRRVVQYPCTFEGGCGEIFNRKNLLEEHLVMVHGKSTPQRLLPLRSKALDFTEQMCVHCGMVLTQALLPRHIELYHQLESMKNLSENKSFPCHLEGCTEIFNTTEDRMEHIQSHIASPPFSCQVTGCKEVFFLEKNLNNHLWNHSKEPSTCDFEGCSKTFEDQMELAKHSKVHYNGKIKCPWPHCDARLTETGQLRPHIIAHSRALHASDQSDYVCEVCQLAFTGRWGLMIHKRTHGEEAAAVVKPTLPRLAKFSCEEHGCPATFCDQKGFFDHFLYHYTKKNCVCAVDGCNQTFSNLITLAKHSKVHFDGKYQCPWQGCKKLLASPYLVTRHVYRHIVGKSKTPAPSLSEGQSLTISNCATDEPSKEDRDKQIKWPLSCSQCFMVFRLKSNLKSHMEYHNEKSEYLCPTCGKKGKHNHSKAPLGGSKPGQSHTCDQCGAKYATISGLKFHMLQKHNIGKWPFRCSYCDKGFVSSREMQRHMPSHTKEKPFVCDICEASFASHTGHRAHMRKHTGQKYVCEVEGCGKVYTTAVSLRGHMAQHAGFCKTCTFCGKTYKNPYGHKCKASREGKKKLLLHSKTDHDEGAQPTSLNEPSETSLHQLKPLSTGLQLQQLPQAHHFHNPQHQVLEVMQQGPQFQPQHHYQHYHHQLQHHPQFLLPDEGAHPQAAESFRPVAPGTVQQSSVLTSPSHSSIQQQQMILMAPQMLPGSSVSHSSMSLMAIPHSSRVPLHHHPHPQHHPHPNMLPALPPSPALPPPQQQSLNQTSPDAAGSLSHINLLHQGILNLPSHSSLLQMQQHRQQRLHQNQQHLSCPTSSSLATTGPEGILPHHPHRVEPSSTDISGDAVCNNYVVFWEG